MDIKTALELIKEATGYKAKAKSLPDLLTELALHFGVTRVGSDATSLGLLKHFYFGNGGVVHFLTNERDFELALKRLSHCLELNKPAGLVQLKAETESRFTPRLVKALSLEIEQRGKTGRLPSLDYAARYDPETRTQTSVETQIIDDLLRGDGEKAVDAIRALMVYQV